LKTYKEILAKHLPEGTVEDVFELIVAHRVHLKITRGRKTKLGDYRPPVNSKVHRITVNNNLGPYLFLITLIHEIAHLFVWNNSGNRVMPHGKEWKTAFRDLMKVFIEKKVFPPDLEQALSNYLKNSRAASGSDINLTRVLRKYQNTGYLTLEDINPGDEFSLINGRRFIKLDKLRTRYRCQEIKTGRLYLVNALTEVMEIEGQKLL